MTAELGKARFVKVEQLEPGMKVHKEVVGRRGNALVNAGEVLSRAHVDKLKSWENRPAPSGPALKRKDRNEPLRRGEFVGGHKVSDFNPQGILVSATLASGADMPDVVSDPLKSPVIVKKTGSTVGSPDLGVESPLFRCRALEGEIKTLEATNAQLGGDLHSVDGVFATEEELTGRKEALTKQNSELIENLKHANPGKRRSKK